MTGTCAAPASLTTTGTEASIKSRTATSFCFHSANLFLFAVLGSTCQLLSGFVQLVWHAKGRFVARGRAWLVPTRTACTTLDLNTPLIQLPSLVGAASPISSLALPCSMACMLYGSVAQEARDGARSGTTICEVGRQRGTIKSHRTKCHRGDLICGAKLWVSYSHERIEK